MKFDELLENHLGALGKFQRLVIFWLFLEEMFLTFQVMGPVFLAATPKQYWCQHPQLNNDTIFGNCSLDERLHMTVPPGSDVTENGGLSHCTRYDMEFPPGSCNHGNNSDAYIQDWVGGSPNVTSGTNLTVMECSEWTYDTSVFESTIVTEWELVCTTRRQAQAKMVGSVFLAGRAVGNVLFGWIADRFGRRLVFVGAGVANVVVAVVAAFTPTYLPFVCVRFLQAILATGKTNAGFVISVEMSGPSRRVLVGSVYFVFWSIGLPLLSGIGYFVRDWRSLLIACSVPEILIYIVYWFVGPESPRWLYMNGRTEEADRIVAKMAKVNKVELPKNLVIEQETKAEAGRPSDLFRTPQIRYVTLIITYLWGICGIAYYCLNLTPEIFGDNLFIVMPVLGAIECVASLSVIILFEFGGRVPTFSGCMALGGACLLVSIPFSKGASVAFYWINVTLLMCGKFVITVAYSMLWIYCGECFPTCIRSMGLSWTAVAARITSPLGPFLMLLTSYYEFLPMILVGTLTVSAGFSILFLPETKGRLMVQTIEEGELFIKENKLKFCNKKSQSLKVAEKETLSTPETASFLAQEKVSTECV